MKASVITDFGGPEVLQVREMPIPEPGPGQVSIRVAYAGVNYAETMARRGGLHSGQPPFVPGLEVSGHIQALGEGVEGLRVGQPVAVLTGTGGYAEIALAFAAFTFPLDAAGEPRNSNSIRSGFETLKILLQKTTTHCCTAKLHITVVCDFDGKTT